MLKTIIVDDEEMVRHGLRYHYHWYKYGIDVAADFADGAAAYEYLKHNHVDLLVTDVVMPHMDGLELAQKARELYDDIKIIFISGYADVKYLWSALKMNAVDYIFKSVDFDELDNAIERVVTLVKRQNTQRESQQQLERQLESNRSILRQQQLVSMLSSSAEDEEELARSCAALNLSINSKNKYTMMVLRIANRWQLLEGESDRAGVLLDLELQNTLQEFFQRHGSDILFKRRQYEYISIIPSEADEYAEMLIKLSAQVQTELRQRFEASTVIGISESFRGLVNLKVAYKDACEAIYNRYVVDDELPQVTIKKFDSHENLRKLQDTHRLEVCNSILDGQTEQIQQTLKRIIAETLRLHTTDEQQNHLMFLLMAPGSLLADQPLEKRGCYASHRRLMEQFLLTQDISEQEECILRAYLEAADIIHEEDANQSNALIKSVCAYVSEHYMEHLSIPALAQNVYLTPTYLCVLFKKHMGTTLNAYITGIRMEAAKRLLKQSNIQLQDICYQVGYLSPSYFSRLFRKQFGVTPSEYRASQLV